MTIIPLPLGGFIQTDGIEYLSGAYVHVHSQNGEIIYRAIRQEFRDKPQETMKAFLEALSEIIPNKTQKEDEYFFQFPECSLQGSHESIGIYDERTPILIYHWVEWAQSPEEIIGALLNCLDIENQTESEEHPWDNDPTE